MFKKKENSSHLKVNKKTVCISGIIFFSVAVFVMICSIIFERYAYLIIGLSGILGSVGLILLLRSFFHIKYKSTDIHKIKESNYDENNVNYAQSTELKQLLEKRRNEHTEFLKKVNETGYTCTEVTFGTYKQLPIDWFVIDTDEEKVLLLSKYVIDFLPCCETNFEIKKWEESCMRNWLNRDFYDNAFTQEEKENIIGREFKKNIDKVFFLSKNEVEIYLKNKYRKEIFAEMTSYAKQRHSKFSEYEISQGLNDNQDYMSWWLRDYSQNFCSYYNFCKYDTSIGFTNGYYEMRMGAQFFLEAGVRPAIYINKDFLYEKALNPDGSTVTAEESAK